MRGMNSLYQISKEKWLWAIAALLAVGFSCTQKQSQPIIKVERDTTITVVNAFTNLFLDSSRVAQYIEEGQLEDSLAVLLQNFYNSRNYQMAWFTEDGAAEQTQAFYTLHQQYIKEFKDSSRMFPQPLQIEIAKLLFRDTVIAEPSIPLAEIELQLTQHFFNYVSYAYSGSVDPEILKWHIPRKRIDAINLLDSLVSNHGKNLEEWEPVSKQYTLLKQALLSLYEIEKNAEWEEISLGEAKKYEEGDHGTFIHQLKRKLQVIGDYKMDDTTDLFNPELSAAVKQYQRRMGLTADGVVGKNVVKELNVPIRKRIEQLLINMERMRWMPNIPDGNGILVNIPQYELHVLEEGEIVFRMDIVVGKTGSETIIFADEVQYVVFSPYWNVPQSIVRSEIYPAMQKNPNYLAEKNMEQIGFSNGLPIVRQKPGNSNSLGRVKFIFPNSYNIYLHDTPSKSLFGAERRAFSHGCIRVSQPTKLAEYLLRNQKEWTSDKIVQAMRMNTEKWVALDDPLPVFISYFTAWVDQEGLLNFREDIYGHDQKMAERLFAKP
jgi:murein L,D-transpeptidase YcbB/YkuD